MKFCSRPIGNEGVTVKERILIGPRIRDLPNRVFLGSLCRVFMPELRKACGDTDKCANPDLNKFLAGVSFMPTTEWELNTYCPISYWDKAIVNIIAIIMKFRLL
ncbi:unnamed protein product [Larinioides sclopetarius]|uniref:Uncharacterized protein n=1 Tax=Larinioides sclopetarius TaxID=280406 RepID=A0AAV1ZF27_9ARAC